MERAERYIRHKFISSPELSQEQRLITLSAYRYALRYKMKDKLRLANESLSQRHILGAIKQMGYTVKPFYRYVRTFHKLTKRKLIINRNSL